MIKENKGITLMALMITVLILIILASVVIGEILDDNGIIKKAFQGRDEYENAQESEFEYINQIKEEVELII